MKFSKLFSVAVLSSLSAYASVPQNAKVCVFEGAQGRSWSTTCDGKLAESGFIAEGETNEMAISLHLSTLTDLGFTIKSCMGFPNSLGVRCILSK